MKIIYLLFICIVKMLCTQPCISFSGDSDMCLACGSSYFQKDYAAKIFRTSDCLPKISEQLEMKILILHNELECDQICSAKFSEIYNSLQEGLVRLSYLAAQHMGSAFDIFLSIGDHYLLKKENTNQSEIYFRATNATIKLAPLTCDILNRATLCVPKGQKAIIKLKTNNIHFFIGHIFIISYVKFLALEQHYMSPGDDCLSSKITDCCSYDENIYETQNTYCSLKSLTIDLEKRGLRLWGFFNLEPNYEYPNFTLKLFIEGSDFLYFFLVNQKQGFVSLFTVLWNSPFTITIINCKFSDSFYLKGLIYFEQSLDEAQIEPWVAHVDESILSKFISSSQILKNTLQITSSTFLNYNLHHIMDRRAFEDKSIFLINLGTTDCLFSDLIFDSFNAQDLEGQAFINIGDGGKIVPLFQAECFMLEDILIKNASNFVLLTSTGLECGNIKNLLVQYSKIDNNKGIILKSTNFSLTNLTFKDIKLSETGHLIVVDSSTFSIRDIKILRNINPRIFFQNSVCKIEKLSLIQVIFSDIMFNLVNSDFFIESSIISGMSIVGSKQGIVFYIKVNNTVFSNIYLADISSSTLNFLDKTGFTTFKNCTFTKIHDLSNFIAADSIYLTFTLQDSSILSCSFLNFYFSLNGNKFIAKPSVLLYGLIWSNFTVRVGYFSAFSNVILELKNSIIIDMIGVTNDNFVRFFYIGRNSSFLMESTKVIDCGYTFEPILKGYAYNYQFLLGQFFYPFFKVIDSVFVTSKPLSLKTGFVALNRNNGLASIVNSYFIIPSKDEFSHNGVTFTTTLEIEFINNTLINMRCPKERISVVHEWGSVFMLGEETSKFFFNNKKALVVGNLFCNCSCRGGAGLTVINYHTLSIENNIFKDNTAWFQIGTLGVWSSTKVMIRKNIIWNSFSPAYGAIKVQAVKNVTFDSLVVERVISLNTAAIFFSDVSNILIQNFYANNIDTFDNGGVIFAGNTNLTIINSSFTSIRVNISGGIVLLDFFSNLTMVNCSIFDIEAFSGGVLAVFFGNIIKINNLSITKASTKSNGAAFYFEKFFTVLLNKITITDSTTDENGVIFFENPDESEGFIINDIWCFKNKASAGSCLYINTYSNISITHVVVEECEGEVLKIFSEIEIWVILVNLMGTHNQANNILSFEGISLRMEGFVFYDNIVYDAIINLNKITNGIIKGLAFTQGTSAQLRKMIVAIKLERSRVLIANLLFNFLTTKMESIVAYCINSEISLSNAGIYGSKSFENFGAFRLSGSFIQASIVRFFYNFGVCVKGIGSGGQFNSITMIFNSAIDSMDPIHFDFASNLNNSLPLIFEAINSTLTYNGTMINIKDIDNVLIDKCIFESAISNLSQTSYTLEIRGIEASNIINLKILNCFFLSLTTATSGSALSAIDFNYKLSSLLLITNSYVKNCSSFQGAGALFISNKNQVFIQNCSFFGNLAKSRGSLDLSYYEGIGAVGIILCNQQTGLINNCNVSLFDNYFEGNYAFYHSPLLYINSGGIFTVDLKFLNNSDELNFTNTLTSYPLDIKMLFPVNHLGDNYFDLHEETNYSAISFLNVDLSDNINVLLLKSGADFNITFFITDSQGHILIFDDFSYATMDVIGTYQFQTKVEKGVTSVKRGWFNFSNTRIYGWPDSEISLEVAFNIPKYTFLNTEPIVLKRAMTVKFRACLIGEILLNDLRCYECPFNSFSSVDPMTSVKKAERESAFRVPVIKCLSCPAKAYCPGGWATFPVSGSWRMSLESKNIVNCNIREACMGYDLTKSVSENLIGLCNEGHYGNLCNDCIKGYGKTRSNSLCENCGHILMNVVMRLMAVVSLMIFYTVFGSYIYSRQEEKKKGYLFIYLRIGISFSQVTNILTFIKVEWPISSLHQFQFISTHSLSLASEEILLNDCLLDDYLFDQNHIQAIKTILCLILPLLLFKITSFVWIFYIRILRYHKLDKATRNDFYIKIIASLIISVFLFHPLIIRTSFNMLNCYIPDPSISSEEFLDVYPNFKCWDSFHKTIILGAVLPGLFIWGLGFPLVLLFLLIKHRKFKEFLDEKTKGLSMIQLKGKFSTRMKPVDQIKSLNRESETPIIDERNKNRLYSVKIKKLVVKSNLLRFLYHGFKNEYHYWQFIILLKKFILNMLINFSQIIGFEIVNLLILLVLSADLYLHITKMPYLIRSLNLLELFCIIGSILIFISVIMLQSEINETSKYFFAILIFMSYLVCFGFTVFNIILSILRIETVKKKLDCLKIFKNRKHSKTR